MKSLYEKGHPSQEDQKNAFAFGRITRVFPSERLCEVKTFMGVGQIDDNHIPKCQWLNGDAHPDGDESTVLPRVGSFCIVFYIDGEPYVYGFFSPLTGDGSAQLGEEKEELNEGDRIILTRGGNKIILRTHGEIQVQSTNTCRTIWFPDRNLINTLCRNYEFRTDGGTVDWLNVDANDNTVFRQEFRDNINRNNVVVDEVGYVEGGALIYRRSIGAGATVGTTSPVWSEEVKPDGEWTRFIRVPDGAEGHRLNVKPDGTTKLEVGGKATVIIDPSGNITITNDGNTSITTKGSTTIKSDGPNTIDCSEATINASGSVNVKAGGSATVKAGGSATVDASSINLKASGNSIKGGAVPANPINNDPITGLPLTPTGGTELA